MKYEGKDDGGSAGKPAIADFRFKISEGTKQPPMNANKREWLGGEDTARIAQSRDAPPGTEGGTPKGQAGNGR